jgi:hypothetical protein
MDCRSTQENLSAYIDKELDPFQEIDIKNHLKECSVCSCEYRNLLKGWDALGVWDEALEPAHLKKVIILEAGKEKRAIWKKILPVAAALILVFGAVMYYAGIFPGQDRALTVTGNEMVVQHPGAVQSIDEEDVIAHLDILQDEDFYDAVDSLVKIDYLPLVDESAGPDEDRSCLEVVAG